MIFTLLLRRKRTKENPSKTVNLPLVMKSEEQSSLASVDSKSFTSNRTPGHCSSQCCVSHQFWPEIRVLNGMSNAEFSKILREFSKLKFYLIWNIFVSIFGMGTTLIGHNQLRWSGALSVLGFLAFSTFLSLVIIS